MMEKDTTTRRAVVKGAAVGSAVVATAAVAGTAAAGSANAGTYYNTYLAYPKVSGMNHAMDYIVYYAGMPYDSNVLHASVMNIQRRFGITQDGWYGSQTRAAVINFQRSRGLAVDGVFGYATCRAAGMQWLTVE